MSRTTKRSVNDAKKAVAYLRKSTDVDGKQTNSIAVQKHEIERWAAAAGIEVVGCFVDHISGSTAVEASPELEKAIHFATTNRVGYLVASKRDRIARDVGRVWVISSKLGKAGVQLVSADDANWQNNDPSTDLWRNIVDAFSCYELSQIRLRTKKAHEKLAREGRRQSRVAPLGFQLHGKTLEPNPVELRTLMEIWKARAQEGMKWRELVEVLNDSDHRPRPAISGQFSQDDGKWTISTAHRWFQVVESAMKNPTTPQDERLAAMLRSVP